MVSEFYHMLLFCTRIKVLITNSFTLYITLDKHYKHSSLWLQTKVFGISLSELADTYFLCACARAHVCWHVRNYHRQTRRCVQHKIIAYGKEGRLSLTRRRSSLHSRQITRENSCELYLLVVINFLTAAALQINSARVRVLVIQQS